MAKAEAAEPVKLTKAELIAKTNEFLALQAERLELSRQADAVKRRESPIKKTLEAWLREQLDKGAQALTKHGFLFRFKPGQRRVDWKQEFIRVAGVDAAIELQENAPVSEYFEVTPTS